MAIHRNTRPALLDWTAEREAILDQWVAEGKLVLTIDYSGKPEQIADAYTRVTCARLCTLCNGSLPWADAHQYRL